MVFVAQNMISFPSSPKDMLVGFCWTPHQACCVMLAVHSCQVAARTVAIGNLWSWRTIARSTPDLQVH